MVDIALVVSEAQGYSGKIGLHAADEAGNPAAQRLLESYQARCGLLSLPPDAKDAEQSASQRWALLLHDAAGRTKAYGGAGLSPLGVNDHD